LSDQDRQNIALQLTSSSPFPVQHLVVSAAGGWLKGQTKLTPSICPVTDGGFLNGLSLNIAGGIEEHEEVSYPIVLIPTGHKGSLVKSTKRQWCRDGDNLLHAPLVTRYRIVFTEKVCTFLLQRRDDRLRLDLLLDVYRHHRHGERLGILLVLATPDKLRVKRGVSGVEHGLRSSTVGCDEVAQLFGRDVGAAVL
jgi:hypothetical protein